MLLAATHTGTLSSTDSRNCLVDASCRESLRCSLQSSCVATDPPLGSLKHLTRNRSAAGQFGDEAFRGVGVFVEILDN